MVAVLLACCSLNANKQTLLPVDHLKKPRQLAVQCANLQSQYSFLIVSIALVGM